MNPDDQHPDDQRPDGTPQAPEPELASPYSLTPPVEPDEPEQHAAEPEVPADSAPADSAAPAELAAPADDDAASAVVPAGEPVAAPSTTTTAAPAEPDAVAATPSGETPPAVTAPPSRRSARLRPRAERSAENGATTTGSGSKDPASKDPDPRDDGEKASPPASGSGKDGASAASAGTTGRRERTGLRRAGRIVTGALVLGLLGGVAAGGGLLERNPLATADPLAVAVPPTEVALACPAGVVAPGASTSSTDTELSGSSDSRSAVRAFVVTRDGAASPATLGPLLPGSSDATAELAGTADHLLGALANPTGSMVLRAAPSEAEAAAAFAVAAAVSRADSGDLRGLTAVACPPSATTSWLVGGTTLVGSSALLTLRNVGATPATVTVRAWDAIGEVPVSGTGTVVPPGQEVTQALEASVPDAERLAIQVTATGGQVSPTVQTSQLTGLTPAGTSVIGPTTMPALVQLLPGVVLTTTTVDEADPSLVRIVNPGENATTVTLDLLGEDGVTRLTDDAGLVIEAGAVADVSLAGAPAGTFTVRVTADDPVVAGAMLVRRGEPAPEDPDVPVLDRTWLSAVPGAVSSAVTIPGLGSLAERAVLVIGNDESDAATVTVTALDATGAVVATQDVSVPATGGASLEITRLGVGTVAVVLDSTQPVSAGVVLTWTDALGEMIGVVAAQPDPQVERSAAVTISGS